MNSVYGDNYLTNQVFKEIAKRHIPVERNYEAATEASTIYHENTIVSRPPKAHRRKREVKRRKRLNQIQKSNIVKEFLRKNKEECENILAKLTGPLKIGSANGEEPHPLSKSTPLSTVEGYLRDMVKKENKLLRWGAVTTTTTSR